MNSHVLRGVSKYIPAIFADIEKMVVPDGAGDYGIGGKEFMHIVQRN
jgi:hypothetical protein